MFLFLVLGQNVVVLSGNCRRHTSLSSPAPRLDSCSMFHCSFHFADEWELPPTAAVALMEYLPSPHYFIPPLTFQSVSFLCTQTTEIDRSCVSPTRPEGLLVSARLRVCARVWLEWPSTLFFIPHQVDRTHESGV